MDQDNDIGTLKGIAARVCTENLFELLPNEVTLYLSGAEKEWIELVKYGSEKTLLYRFSDHGLQQLLQAKSPPA